MNLLRGKFGLTNLSEYYLLLDLFGAIKAVEAGQIIISKHFAGYRVILLFEEASSFLRRSCLKPQIRFEGKALTNEKAQHTRMNFLK